MENGMSVRTSNDRKNQISVFWAQQNMNWTREHAES